MEEERLADHPPRGAAAAHPRRDCHRAGSGPGSADHAPALCTAVPSRKVRQMRRLVVFAFTAALLSAAPTPPATAAWPERPVTIIVPYPPAGTSDVLTRLVGNRLAERLGQPVVVENRAGGAGNIGTAAAARAAPDGHTLVLGNVNTFGINPAAVERLPYDAVRDFAPVTVIADTPNVILTNSRAPFRTLGELIAHARANPGGVSWGSTATAA